jgi:hypothetical protein
MGFVAKEVVLGQFFFLQVLGFYSQLSHIQCSIFTSTCRWCFIVYILTILLKKPQRDRLIQHPCMQCALINHIFRPSLCHSWGFSALPCSQKPPLCPLMSKVSLSHLATSQFLYVLFNIILPLREMSPVVSSLRFSSSCSYSMFCTSHCSWCIPNKDCRSWLYSDHPVELAGLGSFLVSGEHTTHPTGNHNFT